MPNETATHDEATAHEAGSTSLAGKGAEALNALHINIERPNLVKKEFNFTFRSFKNEIGDTVKRAAVKLELPVLTVDGLINAIQDQKQLDFILDVLADVIKAAARTQVDDETSPVNDQAALDLSKLTLEYIANQPKAERTGGGISQELWAAWGVDYVSTMLAASPDAKEEHVKNALNIFLKRYAPVKMNKPVLKKLRERLAVYATETKALDDFVEVVDYLDKRAETLINADDSALLDNL